MKQKKRVGRFLYWTPRVLSILFLMFLALFSLDVFDSCKGFFDCVLGLLVHNIPVLVLLVILIIAWKYEVVGAVAYSLAGLAYIASLIFLKGFEIYMFTWILSIAGPAFLVGILFWLNWKARKK